MPKFNQLSRRERQIMDIVYELGEASAKDIEQRLPDAPSYSAIRATMNKLARKEFLAVTERDLKYFYSPTIDHEEASRTAVRRLLRTFFKDSPSLAMNTLLDLSKEDISTQELDRLKKVIEEAKATKG